MTVSRTRGAARQADSFGVDTYKSTPVVYPGSSGTSTPSIMSTNIAASSVVPVGVRDPLISSRYAEAQDLNPNQITTVGDGGSNLGWTMVRTDRPVVLWPIKSRLSTSSQIVSGSVSAAGSSYVLNSTLTLSGGTGTAATFTVRSGRLTGCSLTPAIYGVGYQLDDIVTLGAGTLTAARLPTAKVTAVAIANSPAITIVNGGTSYTTGNTVTLVGGTGTAAQLTVTVTGGVVTSVTIPGGGFGFYTALPPQVTSVTGGSGTGLQVQINSWSVQRITFLDGGQGITAPNTCPSTLTITNSSGVATGVADTVLGYAVETISPATAGNYTVLPSNPVSTTATAGTGATVSISAYAPGSSTATTFNTGSPRVIYYAPNRIPTSTDYTQRSKGSGVVYLPNPGTWYLQHARDNTAEAITTEYIVIDAQDPAVIARYLAESGCHRVKTTQVSLTSSGARFALIGENRNRTGLLISVGTAALGATASLGLNFGGTATATNTNVTITPSSANWYTTGEQVWKGSVDGWFSGSTAPQTAYVTEWE